jgi:arylsulfatase A-like enzyme
MGFAQGFERYDTSMFKLYEENVGEMFDWIEDNSDRRFFLFWHHFEVHAPYLHTDFVGDVLPADRAASLRSEMKKIADVPLETVWPRGASRLRREQLDVLRAHDAYNRDVCDAMYVSSVLSADRWLGRLVRLLREKGLYDRTLIIVTSDHGEELADRDPGVFYNKHGHNLYEEMVRVPLVIKLPVQQAAGTRVAQVVRMIDLMPTVVDLVGAEVEPNEMQGASLVPLWTEGEETDSRMAFIEVLAKKYEQKGLRTDRFKYIVTIDEESVKAHGREYLPDTPQEQELYDMHSDPLERRNLLSARHATALDRPAKEYYGALRGYVAERRGEAEPMTLDEDTIERLKSLGYLGE